MNSHVRLRESSGIASGTPYVTLSHRWGSEQFFCLQKENQMSLEREIPTTKLRKVFRDAIQLTRSIGIQYLWIDALCIIQDSEADWTREAAMMSAVYANGTCNLAATSFVDGDNGLFVTRQPAPLQPILVDIADDIYFDEDLAFQRGQYHLVEANTWGEDIEYAPLNERGWVMQERMLSPRSLHFGTRQLFWECYEMEACEVFPTGLPSQMQRSNAKKLLSGFLSTAPLDHPPSTHLMTRSAAKISRSQESRTLWCEIVDQYTKRHLTKGTDKLVAIAGLAAAMRVILGSRYLAGLWEDDFINQLIWSVDSAEVQPRPGAYRCPSWSWASVDSRVDMAHWQPSEDKSTALANVSLAEVTLAGHDDLGKINDGFLIISGHLGMMRLYRSCEFVPMDYEFTTLDAWFDDEIHLDAIDTEYPHIGKERIKALHVIEAGTDNLNQEFTLGEDLICFFMPIASHETTDRFGSRVVGLLLLPRGPSPGEFRRIGMFAASVKHSIAQVKKPLSTIGPLYYRSKADDYIYTICIR